MYPYLTNENALLATGVSYSALNNVMARTTYQGPQPGKGHKRKFYFTDLRKLFILADLLNAGFGYVKAGVWAEELNKYNTLEVGGVQWSIDLAHYADVTQDAIDRLAEDC